MMGKTWPNFLNIFKFIILILYYPFLIMIIIQWLLKFFQCDIWCWRKLLADLVMHFPGSIHPEDFKNGNISHWKSFLCSHLLHFPFNSLLIIIIIILKKLKVAGWLQRKCFQRNAPKNRKNRGFKPLGPSRIVQK